MKRIVCVLLTATAMYAQRSTPSDTSLSGVLVEGKPTATGQAPIYDGVTRRLKWQTPAGGGTVGSGAVSLPFTTTANTPLTLTHGLNTLNVMSTCYTSAVKPFDPIDGVVVASTTTAQITTATAMTGTCVFVGTSGGGSANVDFSAVAGVPQTLTHGLNATAWVAKCYDSAGKEATPADGPYPGTSNTAGVLFNAAFTGRCYFVK
jgi:hypothetical protein